MTDGPQMYDRHLLRGELASAAADPGSLLTRLVMAARSLNAQPAPSWLAELERLREDVDRAAHAATLANDARLINVEAELLAQVLPLAVKYRIWNDPERADLLLQLAGVLLPAVNRASFRAIAARRDGGAGPTEART